MSVSHQETSEASEASLSSHHFAEKVNCSKMNKMNPSRTKGDVHLPRHHFAEKGDVEGIAGRGRTAMLV